MPLKGDLASFSLPEIFHSLALNQSTGTLMISDGEARHHLYFQGGSIIPLSDGRTHVRRVGELLHKTQQLSDEDLDQARKLAEETERPMTDVLLELGLTTADDMNVALREKIQEQMYDLFLRKDAYFEFQKGEAPEEYADDFDGLSRFQFNSGQILMEAARRADEWSQIKARIPSPRYIFVKRKKDEPLALDPKADNPVPLDVIEPLLDGESNISDIIEKARATTFDVSKTLYLLLMEWQIRSLPVEETETRFKDALRQDNFGLALRYFEFAQELGLGAKDVLERMQVALFGDGGFMQTTEALRLTGNLSNLNFASLFMLVFLKKHTCTIRVSDSESRKVLYVSPSEIALHSQGAREQSQFGQILVREGKIGCRQLDKALTKSKKTGELLGKTLITSGDITENDLLFAVRKKIIDEIFDIFLWKNAYFELVKNREPEEFAEKGARVVRLSLVSGELTRDLISHLSHFEEISKNISTRAIFRREAQKQKKDGKGVFGTWLSKMDDPATAMERGLARHVDGRKTVRDIVRLSRRSAIEVAEELYASLNRNEIRPLTIEEIRSQAEKALRESRFGECLRFCEFGLERGADIDFFRKTIDQIKAAAPDLAESTQEYKLEGDFLTFSLAELFQSLYLNKHSGTLVVSDGFNEKMVYFSKGVIYLLTRGTRSVSRLGDILIDSGKVKETDVERALQIQKESHKLLGEILVEEGIVAEEDINDAIKEKIKEELFDIFLWENARFTFTKNYFPEEFSQGEGVTRMSLDPGRILMKAVSRIEEWNRIQAELHTTKSIFRLADESKLDLAGLDRKARAVLNQVNGQNNVDDIIERSGVGKFEACKILFDHRKKGALEALDLDLLNEEAEKAFQNKDFELCVKYYEAAMQFDQENEFLKQYLEMIKGNISKGARRKKIVMKGFDLATLLRSILRDRISGTLTAKDARSRAFFYLAPDEFLALLEGERRGKGLADHLRQKGMVTDKQLERAQGFVSTMDATLGEILEKQGVVSHKEVTGLAVEMAQEMLFDLFSWTEVSIEFEASAFPAILEDPEKEILELKTPSWQLLEHALKKNEEMEAHRKRIPSTDLIFLLDRGVAEELDQYRDARRTVGALVDGRRSFRDVLALSGMGEFEVYGVMARLLERGQVRPLTTAECLKEAENAKVFNEMESALAFYKSALAQSPQDHDIRDRIAALKRTIMSGLSQVDSTELISDVRLEDLLRNLLRRPRTGTLQARGKDAERMVHFDEKRILVVSTGSDQGQRLGELLVECRMASQAHVDKALDFQKKASKRLGEILLLQGVITERDLTASLHEKVLSDLGDLFRWEGAGFSFSDGPPPDIFSSQDLKVTEFSCDSRALVEEALHREELRDEMEQKLGSPFTVFRLAEGGDEGGGKSQVLRYVDGKTNLATILKRLKGSRQNLKLEFLQLLQKGVIEPLPLDLAKKKGHEMYMFNDFDNCANLYRWALELDPDDDRIRKNLERAEKYLKGE